MVRKVLASFTVCLTLIAWQSSASAESFRFVHGNLERLPTVDARDVSVSSVPLASSPVRLTSFHDTIQVTRGQGAVADSVDTLQVFVGGDAWASRIDDDDWNNFGMRGGVNAARQLGNTSWYGQIGGSYGVYDWDGHEMGQTRDNEEQIFLTAGFFRPADGQPISAAVVLDYMHDDAIGEEHNQAVDLTQLRYRFGYATSDVNEVGIRGALQVEKSELHTTGNAGVIPVNTTEYAVAYWERTLNGGTRMDVFLGWLSEPGELMMGLNTEVPITDRVAMYSTFMYGKPSTSTGDFAPNGVEQSYSEAYWNVAFGFTFYMRSNHQSDRLLPVANNSNFLIYAPNGAL